MTNYQSLVTDIRPEFHEHDGYPPDWDARRRYVYRRDGYECHRCGARGGPGVEDGVELHAHHVEPKSAGGSHHPDNLQTLCADCHDREHGRVPAGRSTPAPGRAGTVLRRVGRAVVRALGACVVVGLGAAATGTVRPPEGLLDAAAGVVPGGLPAAVADWFGRISGGGVEPVATLRATVAWTGGTGVPLLPVALSLLVAGLVVVGWRGK